MDTELWIRRNLRNKGKPNLTASILANHINELQLDATADELMNVDEARAFLRHLGYNWMRLKNGYYVRKTMEPKVIRHRDQYVVAMEALYSRPDLFELICTDEAGFRVNYVESWGWVREEIDMYDISTGSGPGQGYNMMDFMTKDGLLFCDPEKEPSLENLVGHVLPTVAPSQRKGAGGGKKRGRPPKERAAQDNVGLQSAIAQDNVGWGEQVEADVGIAAKPVKKRIQASVAAGDSVPQPPPIAAPPVVSHANIIKGEKKGEELYKMDAAKFQSALKEACEAIRRRDQGRRHRGGPKHVVFFGDGSSVHLVMQEGAWNPTYMNWDVETEKKPITLKKKCEELGIPIPDKKPKGGYVSWAREQLFATDAFTQQLTAGEKIAQDNGCHMLYGSVASPYFNPKENFYRFCKSRVRKANGPSVKQLEGILDECVKDETLPERCKKWFERAHGYRLWFSRHVGKAVIPPTEKQMDIMLKWREFEEEKDNMVEKVEEWLQSVSKNGATPQTPNDIDAEKLRDTLRALNVQRYRRSFDEDDDNAEEEAEK